MVVLRSRSEIEGLRLAGNLVAPTFEILRPIIRPGVGLDVGRLGDVWAPVQEPAEFRGYGAVRGHGVGRNGCEILTPWHRHMNESAASA